MYNPDLESRLLSIRRILSLDRQDEIQAFEEAQKRRVKEQLQEKKRVAVSARRRTQYRAARGIIS